MPKKQKKKTFIKQLKKCKYKTYDLFDSLRSGLKLLFLKLLFRASASG